MCERKNMSKDKIQSKFVSIDYNSFPFTEYTQTIICPYCHAPFNIGKPINAPDEAFLSLQEHVREYLKSHPQGEVKFGE